MKLYFNVNKNILWAVENCEIVNYTIIGKCTDELLKDYCKKAYGIEHFTKINTLADIKELNI